MTSSPSSPSWYPKAETLPGILADVAAIAGVEVALALGARHGGKQRYIPDPDAIGRDHWLGRAIGRKAARMIAGSARWNRQNVVIPSAKVERNAIAVRRLWAAGASINAIVAETQLSRTLVKRLTDGVPKGAPLVLPAAAAVERCPVCGHRHGGPAKPAAVDPRQMPLPFEPSSKAS